MSRTAGWHLSVALIAVLVVCIGWILIAATRPATRPVNPSPTEITVTVSRAARVRPVTTTTVPTWTTGQWVECPNGTGPTLFVIGTCP